MYYPNNMILLKTGGSRETIMILLEYHINNRDKFWILIFPKYELVYSAGSKM